MAHSDLNLYNRIRAKMGERESHQLIEFIHSNVNKEMEIVKSNLDAKSNTFLTKEDKIDLIDRMDNIKDDLIDRINKAKTELIFWVLGATILQYILLMVTKKFF